MDEQAPVPVVGGGLSGLPAAVLLARLHHLPATTPGRAAHQAGHP